MGAAKRRGTYEERVAQAKERQQKEYEKRIEEKKNKMEVRESLVDTKQAHNILMLLEMASLTSVITPRLLTPYDRIDRGKRKR